jgi:hypothetical protein
MKISEFKRVVGDEPYRDDVEYVENCDTFEELWQTCTNGNLLLWMAQNLGVEHKRVIGALCQCVELVLPLTELQGAKACLETVERLYLAEVSSDKARDAAGEIWEVAMEARKEADDADDYAVYAAFHTAIAAYHYAIDDAWAAGLVIAEVITNITDAVFLAADDSSAAVGAEASMYFQCADVIRRAISWDVIREAIERRESTNPPGSED